MGKKRGLLITFLTFFILLFCLSFESFAVEQTEGDMYAEMFPFIGAYDENNEMVTSACSVPIFLDSGELYLATAYIPDGYAYYVATYMYDGAELSEKVFLHTTNEKKGYSLFTVGEDSFFDEGFSIQSIDTISEDTELLQITYDIDTFGLTSTENYCTGIRDNKGVFRDEPYTSMAIYGGAVFDRETLCLIGVTYDKESFVTVDTIFSGNDDKKNSSGDEKDKADTTGSKDDEETDKFDTKLWIPIICVGVLLLGGGVFVMINQKKGKTAENPDMKNRDIPSDIPLNYTGNFSYDFTQSKTEGVSQVMPDLERASRYLVGVGGVHAGVVIPLDSSIVFGRDKKKCNLMYSSDTQGISNVHCQLTIIDGNVEVTDLGSTYGTFLDDGTKLTPYKPYTLSSGQGFYLADRQYSYRIQ